MEDPYGGVCGQLMENLLKNVSLLFSTREQPDPTLINLNQNLQDFITFGHTFLFS